MKLIRLFIIHFFIALNSSAYSQLDEQIEKLMADIWFDKTELIKHGYLSAHGYLDRIEADTSRNIQVTNSSKSFEFAFDKSGNISYRRYLTGFGFYSDLGDNKTHYERFEYDANQNIIAENRKEKNFAYSFRYGYNASNKMTYTVLMVDDIPNDSLVFEWVDGKMVKAIHYDLQTGEINSNRVYDNEGRLVKAEYNSGYKNELTYKDIGNTLETCMKYFRNDSLESTIVYSISKTTKQLLNYLRTDNQDTLYYFNVQYDEKNNITNIRYVKVKSQDTYRYMDEEERQEYEITIQNFYSNNLLVKRYFNLKNKDTNRPKQIIMVQRIFYEKSELEFQGWPKEPTYIRGDYDEADEMPVTDSPPPVEDKKEKK